MGVAVNPFIADANEIELFFGHGKGFVFANLFVFHDHFGDLFSNCQYGIESILSFLTNNGDKVSPRLAHEILIILKDIYSHELDSSINNFTRRFNKAHQCHCRSRFSTTRLSNQPKRFILCNGKPNVFNCAGRAPAGHKVNS